jgi:hypothetical protein
MLLLQSNFRKKQKSHRFSFFTKVIWQYQNVYIWNNVTNRSILDLQNCTYFLLNLKPFCFMALINSKVQSSKRYFTEQSEIHITYSSIITIKFQNSLEPPHLKKNVLVSSSCGSALSKLFVNLQTPYMPVCPFFLLFFPMNNL